MQASQLRPDRLPLPPEITRLLARIRLGIRQRAFASGLLILISGCCLFFWGTLLLDSGWFWLQTLELPVGLRRLLLLLVSGWAGLIFVRRCLAPLFRRLSQLDLALLVERRFPAFEDRLVLAVETSAATAVQTDQQGASMLQRSVSRAEELAASIQHTDVFDMVPLRRAGRVSGGLLFSLLLPLLVNPQIHDQWWRAFVTCQPVYRQRTTAVDLYAIAEPGSRRVAFAGQTALQYSHPGSADLELEFVIPEGGPQPGAEWIVPERIRVDVLRADGSRSRAWVSGSGSRSFRFVITQLREPVDIEVLAGDFRSTTPWHVEIVDAPGLDAIQIECDYPDYTGWNLERERLLNITGSEVSLPEGTTMRISALAAKPLQAARIVTDRFEIRGDTQGTEITFRDGQTQSLSGLPLIAADQRTIGLELRLAVSALTQEAEAEGRDPASLPLAIPSNTSLRFFLHDMDDVMTVSPSILQVTGVPDQPPVVVAQMTDIGNSVTRRARIPIAGRIRDDYGIQSAGLEFRVDDETNWRPRPFRGLLQQGSPEYVLQRSNDEPWEIFDLEPLGLTEGQSVTLTVLASDANPTPAPGITRSSPMPFRIVSDDELLSLLYTREIALRSRFEEVIAQLGEILQDLEFQDPLAGRADMAGDAADEADIQSVTSCSSRSSNNLRRQANELNALVLAFQEIMRQLINNAIPLHNAESMQAGIIDPLQNAIARELPAADLALAALLVAAETREPLTEPLQNSQRQLRSLIGALSSILENVRDLAEFHEALRDLRQLSEDQRKILEQTRQLQKKQLFDDLLK